MARDLERRGKAEFGAAGNGSLGSWNLDPLDWLSCICDRSITPFPLPTVSKRAAKIYHEKRHPIILNFYSTQPVATYFSPRKSLIILY